MILLDVIVVAFSNVPIGVFLIYVVTNSSSTAFTPIQTLLIITTQLISTIQVFGSFYFYLLVSSTFRNNVKNMLRNIFCFWKPRTTHQVSPSVAGTGVHPTATAAMVSTKMPGVVN